MSLKNDITNYCLTLGLNNIGFIKCREFTELREFYSERKKLGLQNEFEEEDIDIKINPNSYMKNGKTIISIAFPYFYNVDYVDNGFSIYTRGTDYHKVVKKYLNNICDYIESLGYEAVALVDSNTLPERYIAFLAGVGFIGKNNMIITKDYGSYVFLGEIITDLDIQCEDKRSINEITSFKECGDCEICYNQCPTKAINKNIKNSNICVSYLTQKKDLEDKYIKLLNGRVFGCDSCQKLCPYNERGGFSEIEEFIPFDFMNRDNEKLLVNISNKEFKESFLRTSCGWRGKNVLKRNAIIRRWSRGEAIEGIKIDSPYLKEYINRLFDFNKI